MTVPRHAGHLIFAVHITALAGGLLYAWQQGGDLVAQYDAVAQARDTLDRVKARLASGVARPGAPADPPLDPFLRGKSMTLAGADLQERVVSAIRQAGGSVTSTQLDTSATGPAPMPVSLTVSCEVPSGPLQSFLYALEAGTPALILDQIAIDAPDPRDLATEGAGVLKISLTVSGYWDGAERS